MQLPDELKIAIDGDAFCAMATHLNTNEIQNHLMWIDYLGENFNLISFHPVSISQLWQQLVP